MMSATDQIACGSACLREIPPGDRYPRRYRPGFLGAQGLLAGVRIAVGLTLMTAPLPNT
jgi:hypothetical protein